MSDTKLWFKSPDVMVMRDGREKGLTLFHVSSGLTRELDGQQSAWWSGWDGRALCGSRGHPLENGLLSDRFIRPATVLPRLCDLSVDAVVPAVAGRHVKWCEESPDLWIVFNTRPMRRNNPLLALGPYGSLCWKGVMRGCSIREMREAATSVFGQDEVTPFVARLMDLGFLEPAAGVAMASSQQVVKEFAAPDVQARLLHAAVPWYCSWEVCTACDLRCRGCYLPHFADAGPDTVRALTVADQIIEAGIFYVSIMGGEALLRDDLEQIVGKLTAAGVFVKLITNGQSLTSARATRLAAAGLNQIEVSFDGLFCSTHEASRGKGTYSPALHAVQNAWQAGIPRVGIVWTARTGNMHEMKSLPEFMERLSVVECYVSLFKDTGRAGCEPGFEPLDSQTVGLLRTQLARWKTTFPELSISLLAKCSCGRTSVVIGYDGGVRVCPFSYLNVGNLHTNTLAEIWRSLAPTANQNGPLGYCTIDGVGR
jgi:MoaA/NifB/PqqE/SkfB family radical SAM enzyme